MDRRVTGWTAVFAALALLGAACSGADADTPSPIPTATPETTAGGTASPRPAGETPGAETPEAETDRPPSLAVDTGDGMVALGLGTYCWTTVCADAIGVITPLADSPVTAGAEAIIDGLDESTKPINGVSVAAYALAAEPVASGPDWRAWHPEGEPVTLSEDLDGSFTLDLGPGRYLLTVAVSFEGGDAFYGAVIEVS